MKIIFPLLARAAFCQPLPLGGSVLSQCLCCLHPDGEKRVPGLWLGLAEWADVLSTVPPPNPFGDLEYDSY